MAGGCTGIRLVALTALLATATACADGLTMPRPPTGDFALAGVVDSAGAYWALPAGYSLSPYDSEFVYAGTFSILDGNKWRSSLLLADGFAGVYGPRYEQIDSGRYQYSVARNAAGLSVGVLTLDPFSIEYEPAILVADTLAWAALRYVRLR